MPASRKQPDPYWKSDCGRAIIYVGDNIDVMSNIDRDQFHAVVTDPPYGLEFMGKEWDAPWKNKGAVIKDPATERGGFQDGSGGNPYSRSRIEYGRDSALFQQWFHDRTTQMLRVAKPGAHLLSFGGTRMWHRMVCAVEDAGFEIRDTLMWLYGSGFPKSMDVSKAIDKALGAERVETNVTKRSSKLGGILHAGNIGSGGYGFGDEWGVSEPVTNVAKQWRGCGTALKPSYEPIILARKDPVGSVAHNIMDHGCGGLNVDGCRVGTTGTDVEKYVVTKTSTGSGVYGFNSGAAGDVTMSGDFTKLQKDGRWPANTILSHHPECRVVGKKIHRGTGSLTFTNCGGVKGSFGLSETTVKKREGQTWPGHPDIELDAYECHEDCPVHILDGKSNEASRFFYTSKADHTDRPHGKDGTIHPTVKPLDLMCYLVRLVCARGGTVLDPFMGSGSTGCAAIEEGMWFVGIEQSQEYADIAVGRLKLTLGKCPAASRLETGRLTKVSRSAPLPPKKLG